MIIQTEKKEVTKSQEFKTINYGVNVDNLPLLFQMLRTNLYSDLHGSIIREVVSNVEDAHTEAGKKDAIGEVEWVDENRILGVDCQLIIRDFGVGLSPERMETVYGNYLSSTKRGSNDSIGGFGLGSKVPFAYTDSFFVETVFDNMKYRYLCYIDETQLGAISLLGKEKVKRENGTEIIIPIKSQDDKDDFQEAIYKQLSYFHNIKYIGFEKPNNDVLYEDEYCIILKHAPISNAHIVLGKIAYEIDIDALKLTDTEGIYSSGVGVKFPIGELQPTLSRESLFWSPAVKLKVEERLKKARKSIRVQLEQEIQGEKDWAKWYSLVSSGSTARFPNQWSFSKIKSQAVMVVGKDKFEIQSKLPDWFAGHNIRKVTPFVAGYRARNRRGSTTATVDPDYTATAPLASDLKLPCYKLERNLSARTCLWLFTKHPEGFLAISETGEPEEKELRPYYKQANKWMETLTSYDDLPVPDDAPGTTADVRNELYKEKVKLRKLEGKFTAKILKVSYNNMSTTLDNCFEYNMYESKYEDQKGNTIIYGFQEDHAKLCKVAAMLTLSEYHNARWEDKKLVFLKVSQALTKSFAQMGNAYYVDNVLDLKTPLNEALASIATAHRVKPFIHKYHMLHFFHDINVEMQSTYDSLHKFVEKNAVVRTWKSDELTKSLLSLCKDNLNIEMEDNFKSIVDYFTGAELLITPNFSMYSREHTQSGHEGTTVLVLKTYVKEHTEHIKEFLIQRGKQVDGGPAVPEPIDGSIPSDIESITIAQQVLEEQD